jgi:hypothetical protein
VKGKRKKRENKKRVYKYFRTSILRKQDQRLIKIRIENYNIKIKGKSPKFF